MADSSIVNPYHRAFPQLMEGKKVVYVHGFASSAKSGTVMLLRSLMPNASVVARDVPMTPYEALDMLQRLVEEERPDLIIGTSMGGMLAEMLYGYDRILINPAFEMGDTMVRNNMIGKVEFQNPREDGAKEFIVTKALAKQFAQLTTRCFAHAHDEGEQERVWGLFGDNDPIVHTFDIFRQHYRKAIHFHGEHRINDHVAIHYLMPIVRWIDDRQEGRQRPILYLSIDAMRDSNGKPMSTMHKAFETLIEHYNVYFVCPCSTNDHDAMLRDQSWIEDLINAPAYDRILFTNYPSLLYGDYIISTSTIKGFLGTSLRLGSEELKTWDNIIIYFDRLGGQ